MIDIARACRLWTRHVDALAYPLGKAGTHDACVSRCTNRTRAATRATWPLDIETGDIGGLIDGDCLTKCEPTTVTSPRCLRAGRRGPSGPQLRRRRLATGQGAHVPLGVRWRAAGVGQGPLKSAADDVDRTSAADGPTLRLPRGCHEQRSATRAPFPPTAVVAASPARLANMPSYWGVWLRPHGTDFAWGTLRWCQKSSPLRLLRPPAGDAPRAGARERAPPPLECRLQAGRRRRP